MTVYGPDITKAFETYATQFDDIRVQERDPIIDLNAINPLSDLREITQNVTSNQTEHRLSTTAGVDEIAHLETRARGQYTAGYEAQAGMGVRVPSHPSQDGEIIWGYFTDDDANSQPLNGWYFGVDSTGVFVAEVRNGTEDRVYQDKWNHNIADGTDDAEKNPSGFNLNLAKGNIFQIEFIYYGYGPVNMSVVTDNGKIRLHQFTHDGETSVQNTNLPIHAHIDNGSTSSDANELYVGGRQFSIIGQRTASKRRAGNYRATSQTIDDTKWYNITTIQLKDGTDIGSIDFNHVLSGVLRFDADTDATAYRWQLRRGTTPSGPTWETPTTHQNTPDETAMKVDVTSADVQDGSGNPTGVFVDGGTLESGSKNQSDIIQEDPSGDVIGNETMSLVAKAAPGGSGTISEIFLSWEERW